MSKDAIWSLLGNLSSSGSQWVFLVVAAQFFGLSAVADISMATAIVAPLAILSSLSLRAVYATSEYSKFRLVDFLYLRIISIFFLMIGVIFFSTFYGYSVLIVSLFVCLIKIIELLAELSYFEDYRSGGSVLIGKSSFLRGIFLSICFFIPAVLNYGFVISIVFSVLGAIFVLIFYDKPIVFLAGVSNCRGFSFYRIFHLLMHALPLGLASFLVMIANVLPRFFVEYYYDKSQLAIFSGIAFFLVLISMPVTAVAISIRPKIYKHYNAGSNDVLRLVVLKSIGSITLLSIFAVLFSLMLGDRFLTVVYGDGFVGYGSEFVNAMLSSWFVALGAVGVAIYSSLFSYKKSLYIILVAIFAEIVVGFLGFTVLEADISIGFLMISVFGLVSALTLPAIFYRLRSDRSAS